MSFLQTDPLLSSLCSNCRMIPPKYTCPRCSRRTCSLACVKQHKRRVPCSGVRDASAKVSLKDLYTITGINNDYNFITGIERGIERAERIVIHDKGLIPKRSERKPVTLERRRRDKALNIFEPDTAAIQKANLDRKVATAVKNAGVIVKKAPVGMQRNKDNNTSMARQKNKLIWQIEWVTDDGNRVLDKLTETVPLGQGYEEGLRQRIRATMTVTELHAAKKRKEKEIRRENNAKRRKLDGIPGSPSQASSHLPSTETSLWNAPSSKAEISVEKPPTYHFYLLRPFTPSSKPKMLIPLDASKPLSQLLRGQTVLEFPTICVSTRRPQDMPRSFMIEKIILNSGRQDKGRGEVKGKKALVEYSDSDSDSDSESDSDAAPGSSSGSSSDPQSERGVEESSHEEDADEGATSWSETSDEDSDAEIDIGIVDTKQSCT